ncbi:MAG: helix-turn-helix transcriptional regulator [Clostridia bacterium]|nr:helix-turn-helix transcriptional regulator [Clostridia bacterium]
MENVQEKIGEELRTIRRVHNITQTELSKATQIPQSTISAWEQGVNIPNVADCMRLADFYGITVDELLGRIP